MRLLIITGCLAVCLAPPSAVPEEAPPVEDTSDAQEKAAAETTSLDAVTVTGSRVPRAVSDLATSVSQIDELELGEQLGISTNILEALDVLVPGLTVSQEEFRSGCRTNIRGRPAQFLINGVPTNDNLRSSSCGSLFGLSPFAVERVEVLRGATALFGAGAPGGAINLLTRRAHSEKLEVDAAAQWSVNPYEDSDSSEQNLYLGAGRTFNGWDYYAGLGTQHYGVRRDPDGGIIQGATFRNWSFNTSLGWDGGEAGALRFTGLYFEQDPDELYGTDFTQISGERLAGSAFIAQPPNPFAGQAETEQIVMTLAYHVPSVLEHALDVSLYWHDERLIQRSADFFAGEVFYFDSDAENQRLGLRTTLNRAFSVGPDTLDATYGLDLLRQRYFRPQVDPAEGGAVIGYVSPEVILDSLAVFVQPQYRRGAWLVTGGVRHERFSGEVGSEGFDAGLPNATPPGETPDFDLTLFNLGFVRDLTSDLQLYGGFSQGAEISEFGRAARGASAASLINLDAAASDQYELGLRGGRGAVEFSLAAFYSESDKAASLQADPTCAGEPFCPLIPLRIAQEYYGLEATADWQVLPAVRLGMVLTYQEGEREEPGAPAIPVGTDTVSPPRATAYAEFEPLAKWHNRVQATYFAETDEYNAAEEAQGFRDADSVFLVDFSSSYPVGPGSFSLGIANLLDEEYVNVTNAASGDFFYYLSEGTRATLSYTLRF